MSLVFADAFHFIARLNRRDQHHERALSFSPSARVHLITTEWVLLEVADGLANSEVRPSIREYIRRLRQSPSSEVVPASSGLLDEALDLYHRHRDKEWTLTDYTSFIVMRERGIKEALTGDRHFEQAGFITLLK
jgi:predicted nucleic acid-binding protein